MSQLFADLPTMPAPSRPVAPPRPRPSRAKVRHAMPTFGAIITDPDQHRIEAQRRSRRCLSCSDDFDSTGPGNRICWSCKQLAAWGSPDDFSVSASF